MLQIVKAQQGEKGDPYLLQCSGAPKTSFPILHVKHQEHRRNKQQILETAAAERFIKKIDDANQTKIRDYTKNLKIYASVDVIHEDRYNPAQSYAVLVILRKNQIQLI
jgi:hypothetical protein